MKASVAMNNFIYLLRFRCLLLTEFEVYITLIFDIEDQINSLQTSPPSNRKMNKQISMEENCLTRHGDLVHCTDCHPRNHSKIIMSGFLIKSPSNNNSIFKKKWHKRYFILRADKTLEYYTNNKRSEPLAVINLEDAIRIEVGLGSREFGNIFDLVMPKRTYFFSAGSSEIMWLWVEQIKAMLSTHMDVVIYESGRMKCETKSDEKLMQYYLVKVRKN